MEKVNLRGGVIIIGSLLWEDHLKFKNGEDFIRRNWRKRNLNMEQRRLIPLPIRYGRISRTRYNTYTMIFCNTVDVFQSRGFVVPFLENIDSFENLYIQAIALAKAEGIYKDNNKRITASWGSIGILLNPKLIEEYPSVNSYLREKWSDLYSEYQSTFNSNEYSVEGITPALDQNGFMQIDWVEDFDGFDFLLATATVPNPKEKVSAHEIAQAMNHPNKDYPNGYKNYFIRNREKGIETLQDEEILNKLNER